MPLDSNPILNSPYEEPELYYATDEDGALNYDDIRKGRRPFIEEIPSIPEKQGQKSAFDVSELHPEYKLHPN